MFGGDRAGRYLLLRELGRGGMGRVFAGFDPDLQRSVAVKLVQDGRHELDAYLLREGRVLAQLSHPNIVPVFDIGRDGERVFVVMELVDGFSLAQWLDAQPRTTRTIVHAWCEAGRGLAAAHEADVVHRDFKGSNVLYGKDGRVRVADFGLARSADPDDATPRPYEGTRAYLAPEAHSTGLATAASDQFAFCRSLERALDGRKLPRRLRDVIARGLAEDPKARWPSMRVLVDALERTQRTPRAVYAGGAVVLVGALATAAFVLSSDEGCEEPASVVERVLGKRVADTTDWRARFAGACDKPQLARCLETRLVDLASLLDDTTIDARDRPIALAQWRDTVRECNVTDDAESRAFRHAMARVRLFEGTGRPTFALAEADKAIALANASGAKVRARIAQLQATPNAKPAAYEALWNAATDPVANADVAVAAGELCLDTVDDCAKLWIDRLVDHLERHPMPEYEAILRRQRGKQGSTVVAVASEGDELRRLTAVHGESSWAVYRALFEYARALSATGSNREALQLAQRADAIVAGWGEDHPLRAWPVWAIAWARFETDDRAGARADLERAAALVRDYASVDQSFITKVLTSLSSVYLGDAEFARALEATDRAVAAFEKDQHRDPRYYVVAILNGARLASTLGRTDTNARYARLFEVAEGELPKDDYAWEMMYEGRGLARLRAGELDAAEADLRTAASLKPVPKGLSSLGRARIMSRLAAIELRRGKLREARAYLDEARTNVGKDVTRSALYLVYEVEYARAKRTLDKAALAQLVAQFPDDTTEDARLAAHAHALAGDRRRALAILKTAGIPERALDEDCITCR